MSLGCCCFQHNLTKRQTRVSSSSRRKIGYSRQLLLCIYRSDADSDFLIPWCLPIYLCSRSIARAVGWKNSISRRSIVSLTSRRFSSRSGHVLRFKGYIRGIYRGSKLTPTWRNWDAMISQDCLLLFGRVPILLLYIRPVAPTNLLRDFLSVSSADLS